MKDNLNEIWFLTAIHVDESKMIVHPTKGEIKVEKFTRTFGYYRGFDKTSLAISENRCNMHECLYNYLVAERIGEGVHALCDNARWFKWGGKKGWTACKRPKWAEGMTNWALG